MLFLLMIGPLVMCITCSDVAFRDVVGRRENVGLPLVCFDLDVHCTMLKCTKITYVK